MVSGAQHIRQLSEKGGIKVFIEVHDRNCGGMVQLINIDAIEKVSCSYNAFIDDDDDVETNWFASISFAGGHIDCEESYDKIKKSLAKLYDVWELVP